MRILIIIPLLFIINNGCENSIEPARHKTSGKVTITTEHERSGFSFSEAELITIPNPRNLAPDISVLVQLDEDGSIIGIFLSRLIDLQPAFSLLNSFNNADSARAYFNNLSEVPDTFYSYNALLVKKNQVWAVKTMNGRYAVILILGTEAYLDDSKPGAPTDYGEVTFSWKYPPDGTRFFR